MGDHAYQRITAGPVIWHADGRGARPETLTYRESYRATYQGPYTKGKLLAWDGLKSNKPGMVGNDPVRGFDLTMHAGEAAAGSYTSRDLASAPHGFDYQPIYADWEKDHAAHPNFFLPGRTALYKNARFEALNLGPKLLGTGGAIIQDWVGIEFETMAVHGNTAKSRYSGSGFVYFNPDALLPKLAAFTHRFQKKDAFSTPVRPGIAPLYIMFARVKGFMVSRTLHIDPDKPHELAMHWTPDAQAITYWIDGVQVFKVRQGAWAIPVGTDTGGRVRFHKCAFHLDCWQDNGSGGFDVTGVQGHPDKDQVYTIESLSIIAAE